MPEESAKKRNQNSQSGREPYVDVLLETVRNIQSSILLFIIAYMILLIGVAVFGTNLVVELKALLYLLPLLGILGYLIYESLQVYREREAKLSSQIRSLQEKKVDEEVKPNPKNSPERKAKSGLSEQRKVDRETLLNYQNELLDSIDHFFNMGQFRNLCFRLGIDPDNLIGSTKKEKAASLILFMKDRMDELATEVENRRGEL